VLPSNRKQIGFTLIEVLIALVVVAISMVVLGYMNNAFLSSRISQQETQALGFARGYLDTIRAQWQNDNSYYTLELPNRTAPSGQKFSLTVAGTSTQTFNFPASTVQTINPDGKAIRTVSVLVKDGNNKTLISLGTLLRRPSVP
jgi:prepilin-type N-terminal cleavage/methylation domain-containing protein